MTGRGDTAREPQHFSTKGFSPFLHFGTCRINRIFGSPKGVIASRTVTNYCDFTKEKKRWTRQPLFDLYLVSKPLAASPCAGSIPARYLYYLLPKLKICV